MSDKTELPPDRERDAVSAGPAGVPIGSVVDGGDAVMVAYSAGRRDTDNIDLNLVVWGRLGRGKCVLVKAYLDRNGER
jgi:hypothetical protein